MRDPKRIKPFLAEIEKLWNEHPDYRFGQLVMNIVRPEVPNIKMFNMEEDELIEKIEEFRKLMNSDRT